MTPSRSQSLPSLVLLTGASTVFLFGTLLFFALPLWAQASAPPPDPLIRYVGVSVLNVRAGPSLEAARTDQLRRGQLVCGLVEGEGTTDDWLRVRYRRRATDSTAVASGLLARGYLLSERPSETEGPSGETARRLCRKLVTARGGTSRRR